MGSDNAQQAKATPANKNDFIGLLIRAGLIAAAGYGVYRVLRGFSAFKPGEKVSDTALLTVATTTTDPTLERRAE